LLKRTVTSSPLIHFAISEVINCWLDNLIASQVSVNSSQLIGIVLKQSKDAYRLQYPQIGQILKYFPLAPGNALWEKEWARYSANDLRANHYDLTVAQVPENLGFEKNPSQAVDKDSTQYSGACDTTFLLLFAAVVVLGRFRGTGSARVLCLICTKVSQYITEEGLSGPAHPIGFYSVSSGESVKDTTLSPSVRNEAG